MEPVAGSTACSTVGQSTAAMAMVPDQAVVWRYLMLMGEGTQTIAKRLWVVHSGFDSVDMEMVEIITCEKLINLFRRVIHGLTSFWVQFHAVVCEHSQIWRQ